MAIETRVGATPISAPDALAALHRDAFSHVGDRWSSDAFARSAREDRMVWVEGRFDGDLLGFAVGRVVLDDAELLTICTAPHYRGRGLGRSLLNSVEAYVRAQGAGRLYLEVADDNSVALRFYMRASYSVVGKRPRYYRRADGPSIDALALQKCLAKAQ